MTEQKELTFAESIDQAIKILQELRNQEHNNGAFIVTTAHNDPADPSAALVSCVSNGPAASQLQGLLQYIDSDPRIMLALEYYNESH